MVLKDEGQISHSWHGFAQQMGRIFPFLCPFWMSDVARFIITHGWMLQSNFDSSINLCSCHCCWWAGSWWRSKTVAVLVLSVQQCMAQGLAQTTQQRAFNRKGRHHSQVPQINDKRSKERRKGSFSGIFASAFKFLSRVPSLGHLGTGGHP